MVRPTVPFACEKQPATASRGMVVTNHPLASAAGSEMLLAGGNAVDAAVASLFALTVVEPMMVGVLGGGLAHIRMADGRHLVLDGLSTAPRAARADMYETVSDTLPNYRETKGRLNERGALAIAVPGALAAWCEALERFGSLALADVVAPAIRLAERGFITTPYLTDCIADTAADLAADPGLAARFLPGGAPLPAGSRLACPDYAESLRLIASTGARALYGGALGERLVSHMADRGGLISAADLASYATVERAPVTGRYRGYEVVGPPPPSSAGVHIAQMLNILEGYDMRGLGFGTPETAHLLAEVLKIAFADRAVATADPAFVKVPVDRLIAKDYAAERRALIRADATRSWGPGIGLADSHDTTHVTVADGAGNVVAATQTINGLFGACVEIPGTGMLANNYMFNFDPHPGKALSIAPGKRVFTSMAPMMALKDGRIAFALGLPGGLRIFPSAMQAIVNLIDHEMTPQQAVEAPRLWTEGGVVEVEPGYDDAVVDALKARGHDVVRVGRIGGGMGAVAFAGDGTLTGAACWRADGTPVGIAGGLARAGVRFTGV
ncbi:MAG: gamma-glutamyltransferase [Thalassobaculales bacterium]